jgi:hypothetical protein
MQWDVCLVICDMSAYYHAVRCLPSHMWHVCLLSCRKMSASSFVRCLLIIMQWDVCLLSCSEMFAYYRAVQCLRIIIQWDVCQAWMLWDNCPVWFSELSAQYQCSDMSALVHAGWGFCLVSCSEMFASNLSWDVCLVSCSDVFGRGSCPEIFAGIRWVRYLALCNALRFLPT